jgi:hypothetical protein
MKIMENIVNQIYSIIFFFNISYEKFLMYLIFKEIYLFELIVLRYLSTCLSLIEFAISLNNSSL